MPETAERFESSDGWRERGRKASRLLRVCTFLGRVVLTLILVSLLLEFGSFVALSAYHQFRPDTEDNFAYMSPAYSKYPWASEFWKQERLRWKSEQRKYLPFRVWGVAPWHSTYINTDDTLSGIWRRTVNGPSCEAQSDSEVWIFGGSTVYGTGVPDWATMPSYLSRELNSSGIGCFVITNYGSEGYVTNQELILLMEQLKLGRRPAIVIFYDGVNDSYVGALRPGIPSAHASFANIKARVEGSLAGRVDFLRSSYALQLVKGVLSSFHQSNTFAKDRETESKALAVLDNYEANLHLAKILGEAYGFRVFCFWQPALVYGHKPLDPFERRIAETEATRDLFPALNPAYEEAKRRAATNGSFVFLGDIFESVKEPVFIDKWMHLAPVGNELVARSVAKHVEDSLNTHSGFTSDSAKPPSRRSGASENFRIRAMP
jgi:lysophospholipase L1-like esterase